MLLGVGLLVFGAQLRVAQAVTPEQAWQKGLSLYKAYQFEQASSWIDKVIAKPPASWKDKEKSYAMVILSLCQLNQAKVSLAKRTYHAALALDRDVKLPGELPDNVKAQYTSMKKEWIKQNAPAKRRAAPIKRVDPPVRRVAEPVKRRVEPAKRRVALRRVTPTPTPKAGFRHVGSVVCFSIAVAAIGGAIGAGIASSSFSQSADAIDPNEADSALKKEEAYNNALTTGIVSTALWIGAGALAATGVVLLIIELQKKPKSAALLPQPHTNSPALAQQKQLQVLLRAE